MHYINKKSIFLLLSAVLAVVIVSVPEQGSAQGAEPTSSSITGWAWSDTIGWISLSGSNYGLTVEDSGDVTGYAWSSNIGWIKFGGLSDFPGGVPFDDNAHVDGSNVEGWARACAGTVSGTCNGPTRTDGWDGWIYLGSIPGASSSGVSFADSQFDGYAWGSDVVGWIRFYATPPDLPLETVVPSPSGCLSVSAQVSPCETSTRVRSGTSAMLYWQTANAISCTVTGTNGDSWSSLSASGQITSPIDAATRYTLTCTGAEGADPPTFTSEVIVNIIPEFQEI